ncbi:MAG: TaqI-like C-terminal specificity domain-containing protein [Bacillota bacterium]|nr:TaqI-like C-terminal specificity domain-containing protein [Bacillota bacterium]
MNPKFDDYMKLKKQYDTEYQIVESSKMITGTVYTPKILANQMVFLAIKNHLKMNHPHLESSFMDHFNVYFSGGEMNVSSNVAKTFIEVIAPLKLIDLSCGTGLLLLAYIEYIIELIAMTEENSYDCLSKILKDRLYAIDINPMAIGVFKELIHELINATGINVEYDNAYVGNSLIDEFPIELCSFDLILGNPPYIGEKGHLEWFSPIKKTEFGRRYYEGKMDYFYFFIYKGYEYLKNDGTLCYLTSNYFFTADGANRLRNFMRNEFHISSVIDYGNEKVFETKKLHAALYTMQKKETNTSILFNMSMEPIREMKYDSIFDDNMTIHFVEEPIIADIIEKMKTGSEFRLIDRYNVNQGIVTGADRGADGGIFVYTSDEVKQLPDSFHEHLKPFFKNRSIKHYFHENSTPYHVAYLDMEHVSNEILQTLEPFKEKLSRRREVIREVRKWHMLTWPRKPIIFESEKIVVPQRAKSNYFAYSATSFYASADIYYISNKSNMNLSLKALTLVLNSKAYYLWLKFNGKKKGSLIELYATPLKNMPIPSFSPGQYLLLEELSLELFGTVRPSDDRIDQIKKKADECVMDAFKLSESEKIYIQSID